MVIKVLKPRLIAFEVTRRCRFNCRHCRAVASLNFADKELTTLQCKKILAAIARFSRCTIILTGGEPMERSDIYELIRHGKSLKLRMVMATCGYLIDDESIVKLKESGISALSFSLDGSSAETNDEFRQAEGAFDIAVRAAGIARQAGIPFQINTTISKVNVNEILGIAELARRLGANCFNPFILVPTGRGKDIADKILDPVQYEVLLNELLRIKLQSQIQVRVTCGPQFAMVCRQAKARKLTGETTGCMGGRGFGFISYRGDVQTCGFLDVSAGNLVRNRFDFDRIWTKAKLLEEVRNVSGYRGNCAVCDFAGLCGGCRARAYVMTGDYLGSDPVCNLWRAKSSHYQPRGKK